MEIFHFPFGKWKKTDMCSQPKKNTKVKETVICTFTTKNKIRREKTCMITG